MTTVITQVALREAGEGDDQLLRALFAADRPPVLLDQQYAARSAAYSGAWPQLLDLVLVLDEVAVGRVLVGLGRHGRGIVDVVVLPEHRGRGVGTDALRQVLAAADEVHEPVTLRVDHGNPARRLYERLGFTIVAEEALQHVMRREARSMRGVGQ